MAERSVLLVDDNEEVRSLIKDTLLSEEEEYRIFEAENGEKAVEFLTGYENKIDVVILDVQMPVTGGWEALRIIKDVDGWPETKVIMLTVQREMEHALKSWVIGADKYLTKPFYVQQVIDAVDQVLEDEGQEKGKMMEAS